MQDNGADLGTVYYFRMINGDNSALDSYSNYAQLTTLAPTLTQQDHRWYDNIDAIQPTTPQAAENTAVTGVADTDILRIRMNVGVADITLAAGETFKLQYATSTGGPWTDVGAAASGEIWRGLDNATPADGATISATLLGSSETAETYEEDNPSATTPNAIAVGQEGEWDWVVQNNGADASTAYYFRMVKGDDSALDSYTNYPQLTTAGATLTQLDYRWYQNIDALQPTTALAAENTTTTDVGDGTIVRLRMNISNGPTNLAAGATFKIQYATSTGGPWTDVGGVGSGEIWRGANNASVADGAQLSGSLLGSSVNAERQTYEEANNATTVSILDKNKVGEFDWVLQSNSALGNTTYYFRVIRASGVPLETYTNYPRVVTANFVPDAPTALGPAPLIDNDTGWTNDNTPTISFTLSDTDTVQEVQFDVQIATDSGFTSLSVHFTSTLQAQGATSFTVGQSGGTYAVGSAGMTLADNGTGYWWRVKAVDELGDESAYSDAGAAGTADFRVDTTPPSGGAVLDGTGADVDLNDGSLTTMSANWSGFTDPLSGVAFYEYSVGTTPGATDIKGFTSTGIFTTTTDTGLVLQTGQTYYFNVRATDVASNTMTSTVSSDGQAVLPTLTVEVSTTTVELGNFNPQNSNTQTTTVSVTVSTNAYNGYVIRMFALDFLRSVDNPAVIIPDFSAGTYALPAEWSGTGWGFNSGDCDLNGGLFWTGPSCSGNPKYAPITQTAPGNVVGDHTAVVTGATGPIVSEQVVINLRATTAVAQEGSLYSVDLVFIVVPNY